MIKKTTTISALGIILFSNLLPIVADVTTLPTQAAT